jgi:hypothetical protein
MGTLVTKLAARRIYLPTFRAGDLEFMCTLVAELGLVRVLKPAFRAYHDLPAKRSAF